MAAYGRAQSERGTPVASQSHAVQAGHSLPMRPPTPLPHGPQVQFHREALPPDHWTYSEQNPAPPSPLRGAHELLYNRTLWVYGAGGVDLPLYVCPL